MQLFKPLFALLYTSLAISSPITTKDDISLYLYGRTGTTVTEPRADKRDIVKGIWPFHYTVTEPDYPTQSGNSVAAGGPTGGAGMGASGTHMIPVGGRSASQ
jgi:hypothetical protein